MSSQVSRTVLLLLALCGCLAMASGSLNFLLLGDWGLPVKYAGDIARQATQAQTNFTIAIGDNFYPSGVASVDDKQWQTTFEKIYTAPVFQSTWEVVLGNHDHKGNVTAQMAYSQRSARWNFPAMYRATTHTVPGTTQTVQFVYIDTQTLKTGTDVAQLDWIKATLANSTADWIHVVGHHPVYSSGWHGPTTPFLESALRPLLEEAKVVAYWCGHDHGMQHSVKNGVNYFLVGNSAKFTTQDTHKLPSGVQQLFAWPTTGFQLAKCHIKASVCNGYAIAEQGAQALKLTYLRPNRSGIQYSVVVPNPRTKKSVRQ